MATTSSNSLTNGNGQTCQQQQHVGGKAARAKAARNGIDLAKHGDDKAAITDLQQQRDDDDGAIKQIATTLAIIEKLEMQERIKFHPHLITRKKIPIDNHGAMIVPSSNDDTTITRKDSSSCDLSEHQLRGEFTLDRLDSFYGLSLLCPLSSLSILLHLDLSRNELWGLPSPKQMASLANLEILNLSRNWFEELPTSIGVLQKLRVLDASHNMLGSSQKALLLLSPAMYVNENGSGENDLYTDVLKDSNTKNTSILQSLKHLQELNLEFNNKCNHQKLKDKIGKELYNVNSNINDCCNLKMTINLPPKPREEGYFVGESAAVRDPTLLRSQLECWSTTKLRRRLVADFGQEPLSENCGRSQVMDELLSAYAQEQQQGVEYNADDAAIVVNPQRQPGRRKIIRISGIPIEDTSLLDNLLLALTEWKNGWTNRNNERTAINAANYMILTSPESWENLGRTKRMKAEAKLHAHRAVWDLAKSAMESVDEEFANKYTALAVTHNFIGSPHIDRQNVGPFYGLSLGDFDDGTGGIMVECSARVVAHNNTKGRLAKVDGRFPHWVAPYDSENKERFSVIYYQTMGEYQPIGNSVFNLSEDNIFL
jgi:hypothetical protein